jgi:hypothetical protein
MRPRSILTTHQVMYRAWRWAAGTGSRPTYGTLRESGRTPWRPKRETLSRSEDACQEMRK